MDPTDATDRPADDRPQGVTSRPIAWVDGRIVPAADATVPLTDDGFLRGDAVFESVLVRRGRTHALEPHLARMRRSAATLDLRLPVLRQTVTDLLAAWGSRDGVLKLIVTRDGTVRGLVGPIAWPDSISLAVIETPWRTPISGVKSLSYAANQWAFREAQRLGADDALVVDQGLVHELPTAAVCLVHGDEVSSPDPQQLPILDSVTVRELAQVVPVARTRPRVDDLLEADEIFVASATRPTLPVHAIVFGEGEQRELPAPGETTTKVRAAIEAYIDDHLDPIA